MVGKASDPATPPKLTSEVLEAYTGLYEMREANQVSQVRIARTGTDLFFEAQRVLRHFLTPLAADAFAEVPDGRLELSETRAAQFLASLFKVAAGRSARSAKNNGGTRRLHETRPIMNVLT